MQPMAHRRERGQAYALEGIIGAVIVVSALILGLQAVDIAPWTGDEERQNAETRTEVADMLDVAQDTDALRKAVTCLGDDREIHSDVAATDDPSTQLGGILNQTIADSYNYRIAVEYPDGDSYERTQIGPTPSLPNQETVRVTRYVTLSDSDPLFRAEDDGNCEQIGTLGEETFYLDSQSDSEFYAVMKVEVIAW